MERGAQAGDAKWLAAVGQCAAGASCNGNHARRMQGGIGMTLERYIRLIAGSLILISLALAHWVNIHWLWFTAFVGANMLQASFTGFCPLAKILKILGVKPGEAFN